MAYRVDTSPLFSEIAAKQQAFNALSGLAGSIKQRMRKSEIEGLVEKARAGDPEAQNKLFFEAPEISKAVMQQIGAESEAQQKGMIYDFSQVVSLDEAGRQDEALSYLDERIKNLKDQGRDTRHSEFIRNIYAQDPETGGQYLKKTLLSMMDPKGFAELLAKGEQPAETKMMTIYGHHGQTKQVPITQGQEYTPPPGWSLRRPAWTGRTDTVTLYGPNGATKRVPIERGYEYVPPEGWSLTKPGAGEKATVPTGYRQTPTGGLEPIPGGPADPETVKALAEARKMETSRVSAETAYVPIGDDKYQYMSVDKVEGTTKPILRNGKPIVLSEKQVLIAEGKKAQSLVDPYRNKFMSKLGDSEGARLTELKKSALDSRESLRLISQARAQLDRGIYSGAGANIKKNFDKYLQEAGIYVGGRKAANTEAYASMMGLQVGKIIKNFGSGTGLSDADREYAENIVGGRVTLTEDAIRQLLDINERLARFNLQEYNDQVERARRSIEEKDYFQPVEFPSGAMGTPEVPPGWSIEEVR